MLAAGRLVHPRSAIREAPAARPRSAMLAGGPRAPHQRRGRDDQYLKGIKTMPIMMEKLYDALRAANIPEDKARAAAVEVAEFQASISEIKSTLRLHTWILTVNTAMIVAIVGKLFLGTQS
jgi:hypothetical protein